MAGIPEGGFENSGQLEAWLKKLPKKSQRSTSIIVANRAAMRIMPLIAKQISYSNSFTLAMLVTRAIIISRVGGKFANFEIINAASIAGDDDAAYAMSIFPTDYTESAAAAAIASANSVNTWDNRTADFVSTVSAAAAAADSVSRLLAHNFTNAAHDHGYQPHAAARSSYAKAAKDSFWLVTTHDAQAVEEKTANFRDMSLWPGSAPNWWEEERDKFNLVLSSGLSSIAGSNPWLVWRDWYDSRVDGGPSWGFTEKIADELETRIALGDGRKDFWDRDPAEVNAEITKWVEEAKKKAKAGEAAPEIPPSKAASLRPHWINGKLENDRKLITNLPAEQIYGLFQSVKKDLNGLARKAADDVRNSVHKDAVKLLRETAALIAKDGPDFPALCRLAVKEEVLLVYLATVDAEWPNLLAAEYRAISLQLSKALDQADAIKAFKRNAIEAELEKATDDTIPTAVHGLSHELKKLENKPLIGKSVTDALDASADLAIIPDSDAGGQITPSARAAYDALESSNNLLKELVIKAQAGGLVSAAQAEYEKAFAKNFIEAANKAGNEDAEIAAKLAGRILLGRKAIQLIGNDLARRYPRMFGWFAKAVPEHDGPEIDLDAISKDDKK